MDIELGVRRTWLQLEDAKQRLEVTSQTIGQAQESLREIEQRYGGQIATITQLVDAQVALSNAMVRRTTAAGRGRDRPGRAGTGNRGDFAMWSGAESPIVTATPQDGQGRRIRRIPDGLCHFPLPGRIRSK